MILFFNEYAGVYISLYIESFENNAQRTRHRAYFLPKVEIKGCNFMADGKKHLKYASWSKDDYTKDYLLDYPYFIEHYKIIAIDLRKQEGLDVDSKEIQPIIFTGNLDQSGNTAMFFNIILV